MLYKCKGTGRGGDLIKGGRNSFQIPLRLKFVWDTVEALRKWWGGLAKTMFGYHQKRWSYGTFGSGLI